MLDRNSNRDTTVSITLILSSTTKASSRYFVLECKPNTEYHKSVSVTKWLVEFHTIPGQKNYKSQSLHHKFTSSNNNDTTTPTGWSSRVHFGKVPRIFPCQSKTAKLQLGNISRCPGGRRKNPHRKHHQRTSQRSSNLCQARRNFVG